MKPNNSQKTRLINRFSATKTIWVVLSIIILSFFLQGVEALGWSNNTFNNSLTEENLTFIENENMTRWLSIPSSVSAVTNVFLNLSGRTTFSGYIDSWETTETDSAFLDWNGTNLLVLGGATLSIFDINGSHIQDITMGSNGAICNNNTDYFQVHDWGGQLLVMRYDWNFNYVSNFSLNASNNEAQGIMCYEDKVYVGDYVDDSVYGYYMNGTYINIYPIGVETTTGFTERNGLFFAGNTTMIIKHNSTWGAIKIYNNSLGNLRGITWMEEEGKFAVVNYTAGILQTVFIYDAGTAENVSLMINNTQVWNYTGEFTQTNNRTSNLFSAINSYLSGCTIQNGFCLVPFLFHSDTAGILQYLDMLFNNEGLTENSQTYNATTYEIQTEGFILNITYDSSEYTGSSAILHYNNTNYAGAKTGTGNNVLFSANLITPNVAATTDIEFYWTITLTNSSGANYYNSTFNNQTVYNIGIDDCSTYTNEIFNFTLRDEETKVEMDGAAQNSSIEIDLTISNPDDDSYYLEYYNNFSENSNPRICIENLTFGNRIDATISYTADAYVTEYYYLENYILENVTSKLPNNIGLYDLLIDDATSYLLTYQDCNYLVGKDKIIQVWRRYVEDGNYLLVEMTKTDENGQGISHLVSEDIEYKLIVLDEGTIEWETDTFRALCISTPCQISIKQICAIDDFIDYTQEEDFSYTLTLTQATRTVELAYTVPSGASATVELDVTQLDYLMNNTICAETQTGAGGTLSCVIPNTLNNRTYYVEVFKNGEFIEDAYFSLDTNPVEMFGVWGVVLSGFLILTFGLMFIATGWGVVVAAVLGFIVAMTLSLVAFSWTIMIWLAVAGAILVYKISKKVGAG